MLLSYLVAAAFMVLILTVWVLVQIGWGKIFGRRGADPDVLAGRMGCGGCHRHDKN